MKLPARSIDGELRADGIEAVLIELALDLRRLRFLKARFIRFDVVCEPEVSESEELEELELSEELEEPSISARIPG